MSIHPTSVVDPRANVHLSAEIGPYVVIDGPAIIGAGSVVDAFAVIRGHAEIGEYCHIHSHAVIGDTPQDRAYSGEPTLCVIGDGTIVRECATVHRASRADGATRVGRNCMLMTSSHVGHDCVLGDNVTLVSGALLGGHVHVGDQAIISGNAAVHQFVRIGRLAMIGGLSKVTQDIAPYMMTDRRGSVVGVNLVGLKRIGLTPEERHEIRNAYRLIYRSGLPLQQVIQRLSDQSASTALVPLIEFLGAAQDRGLTKGSVRKRAVV